jgi:hypothetical protein
MVVCFLITLATPVSLKNEATKRTVANIGSWGAVAAFILIGGSGLLQIVAVFSIWASSHWVWLLAFPLLPIIH